MRPAGMSGEMDLVVVARVECEATGPLPALPGSR